MKKTIVLVLLSVISFTSFAKLHLGLEAGYATTGIKSGYATEGTPVIGAMIGKKFSILLVDVGVRSWNVIYSTSYPIFDNVGNSLGVVPSEGRINNLSIPVSAGIYFPVKKFNLLAKAVIAPTFLTTHEVTMTSPIMKPTLTPNTEGFYLAAGADLGVGYSITPKVSIDLKYSYLTYTSDLKYDGAVTNTSFFKAPQDERPMMHGFGVQLNLFLP